MSANFVRYLALATLSISGCGGDEAPLAPRVAWAPTSHALRGVARGHNVVLVTLDTTRADRLGCYGHAEAQTPTIDRMAAEGVRFERALTVSPVTLPSHTSILSGQYPIDHGVRDNGLFEVEEDTLLLSELLVEHGYSTAAFVSAFVLRKTFEIHQGFETYDDQLTMDRRGNLQNSERRAGDTVDAALAWLANSPPEPYFVWLHLYDPHQPFEAPAPWSQRLRDPYDAEIAYTDAQLGRFLESFDGDGRRDRTLLILTADHGEGLGEHQEDSHGTFVYDSTMAVPLLLRHPSLSRGTVVSGQVGVVDIMPTVLDALGLDPPPGIAGHSLLEILNGDGAELWHDVYLENQMTRYFYGVSTLEAVSDREWKYINAPRPELYHWPSDPGETRDLHDDEVEVAAQLRRKMMQFRAGRDPVAAGPNRTMSAEERARLEALGYIESPFVASEDLDPKDYVEIEARRLEALAAIRARDDDRALGILRELLEDCPGDILSLAGIGELLIRMGFERKDRAKLSEGIAALERVTELRPDNILAANYLENAYRRAGLPEKALAVHDRILTHAPAQFSSYLTASQICSHLGRFREALDYLDRAGENLPLDDEQAARVEQLRAQILTARDG